MTRLSNSRIESFMGDVLPLWLICDDENPETADIKWSYSGEACSIRCFDAEEYGSRRGVLVRFSEIGTGTVTAEYKGEKYTAEIIVRERKRAGDGAKLDYFFGELHNHTSAIHKRAEFAERTTGFKHEHVAYIKNENIMDFAVITDHSDVDTERDFLNGFIAISEAQPMKTVILPGSESEVKHKEIDRFGLPVRHSGEVVLLNTDNYSYVESWEQLLDDIKNSPLPIGMFPHPQVLGSGGTGIWNFNFKKIPEAVKSLMRLIEMGDGSDRKQNLLHEHSYSDALDAGFKVSPACSSDSHGSIWGFFSCPGKTVVMAEERSKEAIIDALLENRAYATESGNVKLGYTVNGLRAPCVLPCDVTEYSFKVSLDYFREDKTSHPVYCQLISDGGRELMRVDCKGADSFEFSVSSESARWFYLRLVDERGRKTWSCPVWCGRAFDKLPETELSEIRKFHFTAYDEVSGTDVGTLLTKDITRVWHSEKSTASIIIDITDAKRVSAIGVYIPRLDRERVFAEHTAQAHVYKSYPLAYRVSTSTNCHDFEVCCEGKIRYFTGEEIIRFPERICRAVKLEILSTVGSESGYERYRDSGLQIAELSLFEDKK